MKNLDVIEVGKIYEPLMLSGEGISAHFTVSGISVFITFTNPTPNEVTNLQNSPVDIGLSIFDEGIPFLSVKCGLSGNWMQCILENNCDTLPTEDVQEGCGYFVKIILADAVTGVVHGIRVITISTELSKYILKTLRETKKIVLDPNDPHASVALAMHLYSRSPEEIAQKCPCPFHLDSEEVQGW